MDLAAGCFQDHINAETWRLYDIPTNSDAFLNFRSFCLAVAPLPLALVSSALVALPLT